MEDDLIPKPNEFDAATKVMESGLLRVLTNESSESDEAARPAAAGRPNVLPAPPARGSRVFLVAGIVAAVVLAFDASLFVLRPRHELRPPAVAATPEPLPKYMLVPLDAPPLPAPAPPTTTAVATALPDRPVLAVRSHRHSHHRHAVR